MVSPGAVDEGGNRLEDLLGDDGASCELMLEALQEHLRSIEERLVELAGDLLPSLTPPPGYSRSEVAASTTLNCREEEQRRLEEDELKEAKQKEKAKILEEKMHHLEVLADRERQYAVNRRRYTKLMSLHTDQQKVELNKQQKRFEKRREKEQAKERAEMLKKKPVRYKATGETDYTFLAHLPQTLFYKIVAMETELKKAGKLNGVQDIKEFWDNMLAPPPPPAAPTVEDHKSSHRPLRIIEDIVNEEELEVVDSDDVTNSWAITATAPSTNLKFPRSRRSICETTRFVPTQVPVLKPLSEIFDSDSASQKEEEEQLKRHKARIEFLQAQNRTVNEMYQTARANEITMRRMLEDSGLLHEEPPKLFPDLQTTTQTKPCTPKSSSQSKTSKMPAKTTAFVKGSKQILISASSSTSSNQAQSSTKRSPNVNKRLKSKPVPLHIGAIEKEAPVKEARQTSLWQNYAKKLAAK